MARLVHNERTYRKIRIYRLLQRYRLGLRECEIAQEMSLHRRTVNNYLRELRQNGMARKDGWLWFPR